MPTCSGGRARLVSSAGGAHRWEVSRHDVSLAALYTQVRTLAASQTPQHTQHKADKPVEHAAEATSTEEAGSSSSGSVGHTRITQKRDAKECVTVLDWSVTTATLSHVFDAIVASVCEGGKAQETEPSTPATTHTTA